MKNRKGFTLVELLAVIVILAIIMILAIPSVLSVMKSSKSKSFVEYITKVYVKAEEKSLSDELNNDSTTCTIYNIKDLFDSTGNYDGYVMLVKNNNDTKYYITMWDTEYMVYVLEYSGDISEKDLETFTNANDEKLSKEYMVSGANASGCKDSSGTQIYYTGYKNEGAWTAHYTNGAMDECFYSKSDNPGKYVSEFNGRNITSSFIVEGGKEYYCTGSVKAIDGTKCVKSLDCCTGGTETNYYFYFPTEKTCGYYKAYYEDTGAGGWATMLFPGAGLPATSYTG